MSSPDNLMKIYRALRTDFKTQGFGVANTAPQALSLYQSLGMLGHNGWDWGDLGNNMVYFDCDTKGLVVNISTDIKLGYGVTIVTETPEGAFSHRYWHLKDFACSVGQILETADPIGHSDNTGMSTGPHLHRDLKRVNKDRFGNWQTMDKDNGYFGAIDITPYFENIFVVDKINLLKEQLSILTKLVNVLKQLLGLIKQRSQ